MNLWENIESLMKDKGIKNPNQLSALSGVAYTTLTDLKKGKTSSLNDENKEKLAIFFNVSVDVIIYGKNGIKKEPSEDGPKKSILIDTIVAELVQLPVDKQQEALRYIRYLKSE